jgi:ribosomal protein S18 acetylase RimI-like enzyme
MQGPIEIHPLTPDRMADFLAYFDTEAFTDNPRWGSCYCQFLYLDHNQIDWRARTAEENRAAACDRICAGRMHGLLAYREGCVVGWCNAAARPLLHAFDDEPDPEADRIGEITCFVVRPDQRRTGVARALLDAACEQLRAQGLAIAEAIPLKDVKTDAEAHHGPIGLFEQVGFHVHFDDIDDGRLIMRRALA